MRTLQDPSFWDNEMEDRTQAGLQRYKLAWLVLEILRYPKEYLQAISTCKQMNQTEDYFFPALWWRKNKLVSQF
jgi:hypothetical protein